MTQLARLLRFVQPYTALFCLAVVLMAIAGMAHASIAALIRPVFDRVLNPGSPEEAVVLFTLPLSGRPVLLEDFIPDAIHNVWTMVATAIMAVFLLKGIADYLGNLLINRIGLHVVSDLRQAVFRKVLRQDHGFFEQQSTGQILSAIMSDIERIQVAVSHILADFFRQAFMAAGLLFVVLQRDWRLAVVSLTVLPFVLIPTLRLGKRIRRSTRHAQDDAADMTTVLQEALGGHQVIKAFHAESRERTRFRAASLRFTASTLRYVAQQSVASPIIEFFGAVTIVGLLTYAREQIKAGQMTTGDFASFVTALLLLYEPVKRLAGIHNIFQQALGASQTVFGYLDEPEKIADLPQAKPLLRFHDAIVFEDVSFRYPAAPDTEALRGINLHVNAGEIVALVGPSGAGKTTLANLLPRFYDPSRGSIQMDGHDIRSVRLDSLRQQIGIVAQDTFLFNDTVANNLRIGRQNATDEEVAAAARAALAEEFISRLPDGYNTLIGERGAKLSGGQRQRMAIARALLKNAPILVLDEATSHLDTESEMLVQQALSRLMENRTVIVIAHRLSTVRRADKIVVMEQGQIAEIGTHAELVNKTGIYQRLHALQFVDDNHAAVGQ